MVILPDVKPIIFSGPMIRALLDGRKSQTRRIMKPQPSGDHALHFSSLHGRTAIFRNDAHGIRQDIPIPYAPGDLLWCRETGWERPERTPQMMRDGADTWEPLYYDADGLACFEHEQFKEWGFKRRPSIHMPRWASRLTLEVTEVRVQRVQEISEADAFLEGVPQRPNAHCRDDYADLWNSLYGPDAWERNDWVCAISFRVHHQNIDALLAERRAA